MIENQSNKRVVTYSYREQDTGSTPVFSTMAENCNICSFKCFGIDNYDGSCCSLEDRDYIIGPHTDCENFLKSLSQKFGREIHFKEVFIEFEEGKKLFPNKKCWQNPLSYPCLRVELNHPKKPCIFYNTQLKACNVYDIRPEICRTYKCLYLAENG